MHRPEQRQGLRDHTQCPKDLAQTIGIVNVSRPVKRNQSVGLTSDTESIRDFGRAGPIEMLV
jgi:hypothetical protein